MTQTPPFRVNSVGFYMNESEGNKNVLI